LYAAAASDQMNPSWRSDAVTDLPDLSANVCAAEVRPSTRSDRRYCEQPEDATITGYLG
jgi:hypothetical protein